MIELYQNLRMFKIVSTWWFF